MALVAYGSSDEDSCSEDEGDIVSNDQNCFSPHQSVSDHFSLPLQKDLSGLIAWWDTSPCEASGSVRIPHLARSSLRYGRHPLSLSPPFVPRLPKIDETPVNIVEIVI